MSDRSPMRVQISSGPFRGALPSSSRYDLILKIASGGMATVYVGAFSGAAGFRRIVAIKRAHPHLLEDPTFKAMLVDEARMASLVRHPNVIGVHDVEEAEGELFLAMEYIEGASLAQVIMAGTAKSAIDASIAMRIIRDACEGLHAIHLLHDDDGQPLGLVHRDISPQNILVGIDGMSRVADFGIAKASSPQWAAQHTVSGALRGKVGYMAPEYIETGKCSAQSDVFSLGVVAWEALTRRRLFKGSSDVETMKLVRSLTIPAPSSIISDVPQLLDEVILKSLSRDPIERWPSARAFGEALEHALGKSGRIAFHGAVELRMRLLFGDAMASRRAAIHKLLSAPHDGPVKMSEALKVAPPVNETPATRMAAQSSPTDERFKIAPPEGGISREESSGSGATLDARSRRKAAHGLALSSAGLGVVVVALAVVAFTLVRNRPKSSAAEAPIVTSTPSAVASEQISPTPSSSTVRITPAEQTSAPETSRPISPSVTKARHPPLTSHVAPVAGSATTAIVVEPLPTPVVPKNPYAP